MLLAIDQSFTSTGFVVYHNNSLVEYGVISTNNSDIFDRALIISERILNLVVKYDIHHVRLEGLAFGSFGSATRNLSGLQFSIITLLKHNIPSIQINIVPPSTLKKFGTKTGKATKPMMFDALPDDIKQEFKKNGYKRSNGLYDITDAYHLATYN